MCGSCYGSPSLCPALEQKAIKIYLKIKTTENKNKKGRGRQNVNGAQARTCMYTYVDHMYTHSDIHKHKLLHTGMVNWKTYGSVTQGWQHPYRKTRETNQRLKTSDL